MTHVETDSDDIFYSPANMRFIEQSYEDAKNGMRYTFDSVEQLSWIAQKLNDRGIAARKVPFEEMKLMIDELKDIYDKEHGEGRKR